MNEGTHACGAPARVDPDEFANATDHLYAALAWLTRLQSLHAHEAARFGANPENTTAADIVSAWQAANAKVREAMAHLVFVTDILRSQRDRVVAALEAAADRMENQT